MVPGLHPREASERLSIFQAQFDELWSKYQTYSGGEQLFGLVVSEYPSLQTIRKELGLLQKLYGLYNTVIDTIDGYYDILWTEVDIEKINNELIDFQNRYFVLILSSDQFNISSLINIFFPGAVNFPKV